MLETRKIIFLVVSVILLAVLLWVFVWQPVFSPKKEKSLDNILSDLTTQATDVQDVTFDSEDQNANSRVTSKEIVKDVAPEEKQKRELENFVSYFVERFGSYSNQTNMDNIKELKSFATDSFSKYIDKYVDEIWNKHPYSLGYFGVVTKVVVVDIDNYSQNKTEFTVKIDARREEKTDSGENTYNQKVVVEVLKTQNGYKINKLEWK